jgi:hypothetical protein
MARFILDQKSRGPEPGIGSATQILAAGGAVRDIWFVDTNNGSDNNDGRDPSLPLATIQAALDAVGDGDTILVAPGGYTETLTTPVYGGAENVSLIGLNGGGLPRGPTIVAGSNTSPALDVRTTRWRISGFTFINPTDVAGLGGAIRLNMDDGSPTAGDSFAPDTLVDNCLFVGAGIGIDFVGAPYWCTIQDCEFFVCTVGITCSNSAFALPQRVRVIDNLFRSCTQSLDMAFFAGRGFYRSLIEGNKFFANNQGANARIDLTGGRENLVVGNYLDDAADAASYVGGTNDMWNNYTDDAAAQPEPGVP